MLGGGAAIVIVAALGRPVNSNNQTAAEEFAATLASVRSLAPGQSAEISFTEDQISSYFHLVIEPTLNGQITDGQVRLLDSGQLLISGHASQLDGARFAATFAPQQNVPRAPLRLTGALVRLVPLGNSPLGWVPVPTGALQPMADSLNSLFGNVEFTNVRPHPDTHAWDVTVMGQ